MIIEYFLLQLLINSVDKIWLDMEFKAYNFSQDLYSFKQCFYSMLIIKIKFFRYRETFRWVNFLPIILQVISFTSLRSINLKH